MKRFLAIVLVTTGFWIPSFCVAAEPAKAMAMAIIHSEPLHAGRINPRLFGNFIELLDDVAPGMWAEMLNDRSFEGVTKLAGWCYYDGAPDFCDREWDTNATWSYDAENPFNGKRSVRLNATRRQAAVLTQSGLAVKMGMGYACSGYFRTGNPKLAVTVRLKTRLPNGEWMMLGSAKVPSMSQEWQKFSTQIKSKGATDRAVFEVRAESAGTMITTSTASAVLWRR
jgi:hypothetical protein